MKKIKEKRRTAPNTVKGSRRLYEVNAAVWFDMLGYGSMLEKSNFDPTKQESISALQRLRDFHAIAARHSSKHFHITAINDGIIAVKDLSPRAKSVTAAFIARALSFYTDFNKHDISNGYPGGRMVIATGFRVREIRDIAIPEHEQIKSIKKRLKDRQITVDQAINEAYKVRPHFGLLPEIQANFAFTKAYLVDNAGSKGGFGGAKCYLDLALFQKDELEGLTFSRIVEFEQMGIKGRFGELSFYDKEIVKEQDFSDAFEIAHRISEQEDVANLLKANTFKNNLRLKTKN